MLALSCAEALEKLILCTDPLSENAHALGTSRNVVCGELASLGILGPISAVFAARGDYGDAQLTRMMKKTQWNAQEW